MFAFGVSVLGSFVKNMRKNLFTRPNTAYWLLIYLLREIQSSNYCSEMYGPVSRVLDHLRRYKNNLRPKVISNP